MMDKAPESLLGEMSVMDTSGHKQLKWNMESKEDMTMAKETFDNLIGKGYSAFGSHEKAEAKHSVKEFDPTMKELIMVPRNVGG
jgi:hypothetical protein